jgi:hypothetical protein
LKRIVLFLLAVTTLFGVDDVTIMDLKEVTYYLVDDVKKLDKKVTKAVSMHRESMANLNGSITKYADDLKKSQLLNEYRVLPKLIEYKSR